MRAVPTWVDKVHDRERNEQVCAEVVANGGNHNQPQPPDSEQLELAS